ncbi:MAG TPA: VOC family protein [Pseudolabrys sp.]|nr:VOC family protein [Pseudolabrys sp.]
MGLAKHKLATCLWFDTEAEEAAKFYCSVFRNSKIGRTAYYPEVGQDIHGKSAGSVMTVEFELEGMAFLALNGGTRFKFNEAISLQIPCETQEEIDYYWNALTADGGQESQCGWLKDKYGLSWQVFPAFMGDILSGPDRVAAKRAMEAFMPMQKFDLAAVKRAYEGQ